MLVQALATVTGVFAIALDLFKVAGGGELVRMGLSMLKGASQTSQPPPTEPNRIPSPTSLILYALRRSAGI